MTKIYWNNLAPEIVTQIQDAFKGILTPDGTTITVDGDGIISAVVGDNYVLPTASATVLGGVKVDGTTITIDANGVITAIVDAPIDIVNDLTTGGADKALSAEQGKTLKGLIDAIETYTLPTASTTVLGGVKIDGTSIKITADGTISAEMPDLSQYIKTVNSTIAPDAQGNIVLTAGNLDAYTKSEIDAKITEKIPMVGTFTTTVNNTGQKHYVPNITLNNSDYLQVFYNGLVLKETEWNLEELVQGEGYIITLLVEQAENDLYNNVHGTVFRGFRPIA